MPSPAQRLLRTAIPPALEAEYAAAKAEYARAVARLSVAKAAVTAQLDQEGEKRRKGRLAYEAAALEAWLSGGGTRKVCEIAGLKPSAQKVSTMVEHFTSALLFHDELYGEYWWCKERQRAAPERAAKLWDPEEAEERDRQHVRMALERYRDTVGME